MRTRGEGVKESENLADVINGCSPTVETKICGHLGQPDLIAVVASWTWEHNENNIQGLVGWSGCVLF